LKKKYTLDDRELKKDEINKLLSEKIEESKNNVIEYYKNCIKRYNSESGEFEK